MYKLISIAMSHYNEKARWGLDRFSLAYKEYGYMPLLHMPHVAWAIRGSASAGPDKVSSRFSTPVLLRPEGDAICDSAKILRYLDAKYRGEQTSLYAAPGVDALEADFHDSLGAHTRRLGYFYLLGESRLVQDMARQNVGPVQAGVFRAFFPVGRRLLERALRIDAPHAARSKVKILETFERVNALLSDSRPYLCGDQLSAADISFACMAAPALLVTRDEGFGAYLPSMEVVPAIAGDFARTLRDTAAGSHALRMFHDERSAS